jgi:hypothetical protein
MGAVRERIIDDVSEIALPVVCGPKDPGGFEPLSRVLGGHFEFSVGARRGPHCVAQRKQKPVALLALRKESLKRSSIALKLCNLRRRSVTGPRIVAWVRRN